MNPRLATSTGRRRALALCVTLLTLLGVLGVSSAARAGTLTRGFVDDVWFDSSADGLSQQTWIAKTEATGAKIVQIEVDWAGLEPNAPKPGAQLTSPSAPQFNFSGLDQRVEEIMASGLQPVFLVTDAPHWAQGRGGTAADYAMGGYKPNARAFGDLAQAMARRYSGSFPNPLVKRKRLPRVRYMQAWAEANTDFHLMPQWTKVGGHAVNTGASMYRQMLDAFYKGVKAGDPRTVVLASGLEGYGDAPFSGLQRTHPVTFMENLLCLTAQLKRAACAGGPAHFDVLAADPYEAFSPSTHAVSPLDASAPDLGRLTKVVKAGLKAGTLLPHKTKPLWVTEFGYDSKPPNPQGVSTATQAKWLEQGFYVFWHEGASVAMWYLIRDQTPPYNQNYFSGVFFRSGKKKPSYTAYRFPFVVMNTGKTAARAWGIAPVGGSVKVQVRSGGGWKTIRSLHAAAGRVFDFTSSAVAHGYYRASIAGQNSLVWKY
ncbi:MAG TPA: hypothetical protein VG293_04360 [Solirubrobacteraceae bacterium]|nr:hypothetical protein [Solirubrobacteraceae bacterium]